MFGRKTTTTTEPAERAKGNGKAKGAAEESAFEPLWQPTETRARKAVEQLLLERKQITEDQLLQARQVSGQTPGKSLAQILLGMNVASEAQILSALAETLDLDFENPTKDTVEQAAFELLSADYMRKNLVLPLRFEGEGNDNRAKTLVVGMTDPNNVFIVDDIRNKTKRPVRTVVCTGAEMARVLELMMANSSDVQVEEIIKDIGEDDVQVMKESKDDVTDLAKIGSESPIIRFVNYLIFDAIKQGASDIHIEPKEKELKIRYRIDGILFAAMNPPQAMQAAIISRLKIMANLDIAERRLPQDGRIRAMVHGRKVDLRLSTLPSTSGEKCVMRILDNKSISVSLDDLGFSENALTIWKAQIDQPHGILLVTGPTGSGKTTTLYASLRCMDASTMNISTVEDPVEYHLGTATQVQVHDKIGMSFSAALRSLLRQDPDVVMLGEIRDSETANIAVQAALTGHLVLSTLHTNDAPSSVTRLINVGVEPYLISAALNAVLAQRLVRKICQQCREEYEPTEEMKEFLKLQGFSGGKTYRGKGCDKCRKTGYAGRLGIYEMMVMDDSLRDVVTGNPDVNHLRKLCRERGLITLREDGFQKVMKGLTTVDEILRVTENA